MFRGIIMPIFRRTNTVTVCYCMWCAALVLLDVVGSGLGRCVVGCEHCEGYCWTVLCCGV